MNALFQAIDGHKTDFISLAALAVGVASIFGYVTPDQAKELYALLAPAGVMAIRSAMRKSEPEKPQG